MNVSSRPAAEEWRINNGDLSAALLRPLHPIHNDVVENADSR